MPDRFADAVIVAAGSSSRMGGVDKLMEPLHGKPVLQRSVEAIAAAESVDRIVVVSRADRCADLARQRWLSGVTVTPGGEHRSASVRHGLRATQADVVLVHDGARPLVSSGLVDAVARAARERGAAVPVLPVADSLKRVDGDRVLTSVERDGVVRTQTPQGALRELLEDALRRAGDQSFSDEAAVLEAAGIDVATVPGEGTNIKVTEPSDLVMARALAGSPAAERLGLGEDVHGFGPADGLMLGGIAIPEAPRLYGHSDGDAVLHALATAVLSAVGLGDLGRLFPDDDRTTTGISSDTLLSAAVARVNGAGWLVDRAQVSIIGARPRLGAQRLEEMRGRIAALLGVEDAGSVSVTASSGNLSGPEGAGRVIRATALVGVVGR